MSEGEAVYLIFAGTYEMARHEARTLGLRDGNWKYVQGPEDVFGRRNFVIHLGPDPFGRESGRRDQRKLLAHEMACQRVRPI